MIESKGYKITPIDGDLAVSRNTEIGRDVDIHGEARVAGSLKVEGFLDAPNIKGVVKGLFATEEELKREYPNPRPGWCAIVLADDKSGFLYLAKNREWEKQSEEARPFDFIVDSINVFASKGELADETQRAQNAENQLQLNIEAEADTRMAAVDDIKGKAALFGTFAPRADAEGVLIKYENINHNEGAFSIPVATEGKAGIVSAADKKHFVKSITWNNDTDLSNMNDFVVAGVYDIKGERTRDNDNLPILNTGGGHSFNARLTVLDSSISGSGEDDDKCITQVLSFSNRLGQGEVYIRTGKGSSLDNLTFEKWSTLQRNVNVGEVGSLDDLKDNGIYSGVWLFGSLNNYPLTFVCVVINDYFIGTAPRRVSQFVYGLSKFDGSVVYQSRVWDDSKDKWGDWEILNQKEISSMIKSSVDNAIKGVIADAPEAFDTLKEIADWIADDETGAVALANAISANAAAITAERTRAIGQEGLLNNAIAEEKSRAERAEQAINDKLDDEIERSVAADQDLLRSIDEEARRATEAEEAIKDEAVKAGSLIFQARANAVALDYKTIEGVGDEITIPAATTESAGVMSVQDKVKLDSLSPGGGGGVAELMVEVTYSELVALRDNNNLLAGMKYRITDYVTTTVQKNTKSANHPFDVIVEAISENELSELAQAIQHEGDTYFDDNDLGAWQLWYSLNNDTNKYAWADAENGKGVIYRMIDEKRNDCPYDFKNIQFIRYELNAPGVGGYTYEWQNKMSSNINKMFEENRLSYIWHGNNNEDDYYWEDDMSEVISSPTGETKAFFTFSNVVNGIVTDKSMTSVCHNNIIKENRDGAQLRLNNIVFFSTGITYDCYSNSFGNGCYYNSFDNDCYYNSFGNDCYYNSFGTGCNSNSFGTGCNSNSFGTGCNSNSFGNGCNSNSFGNDCYYNSFGTGCNYNSFGNGCNSNSFGNDCNYNSFGTGCNYNSFGNGCYYNSFGNDCYSNSFGNDCYYNSFRDGPAHAFNEDYWVYSYDDELIDGVRGNKFGDRCRNLLIYTRATTGGENSIQNLNIAQGLSSIELDDNDVFIPLPIEIDIVGQSCELKIGRDSNDEIKVYCEADLV